MPVGESHALSGKPVYVRRRDLTALRVVTLHISVAEIVGEDDEDIGFGGFAFSGVDCGQRSEHYGGEQCEEVFHPVISQRYGFVWLK